MEEAADNADYEELGRRTIVVDEKQVPNICPDFGALGGLPSNMLDY